MIFLLDGGDWWLKGWLFAERLKVDARFRFLTLPDGIDPMAPRPAD